MCVTGDDERLRPRQVLGRAAREILRRDRIEFARQDQGGHVHLEGPAVEVFEGRLPLAP